MDFKHISFTDSGMKRNDNQDSIYAFKNDKCAVFVVADGMGGYENGKNASDTLIKYIAKYIELDMAKIKDASKQFDKPYDSNAFFEDMKESLLEANKELFENYTAKGHSSGSTLIMLAIYDNAYNIFWAGDSHIYQVVDDELVALTVDDVWENDEERTKGLTPEQIKKDSNYGKLTNAFGTVKNVNIHTMSGIPAKGMKFFLCSDGVYKYSEEEDLKKLIMSEVKDENKFKEEIKSLVYKNGAPDNFSYIYLELT